MKLPWNDDGEKERLEQRIKELEEERERLEQRFEAEKERRSELARKKQEAEEELNRLQDRVHALEDENSEEEETSTRELVELGFGEAYRMFRKLEAARSPEKDFITVYCPSELEDIGDIKGLKNSASREQVNALQRENSYVAFLDPDVFDLVVRSRPFFEPGWHLGSSFELEPLIEFMESEKTWALVSAGKTRVYRERKGEVEQIDVVKSRVDRKHSKGGYSQDRFERKREEQVQQHLEKVEEVLDGYEDIYLLGEKRLCEELPGEHLGGFDPNKTVPEAFYSFRKVKT